MRRVMIRADIGAQHGMGHAVRCKALAAALEARGAEVCFVTSTPALGAFVAPMACTVLERDSVFMMDAHAPWGFGRYTMVIDTKAPAANDDALLRHLRIHAMVRVVRIDHPHAMTDSCDLLIGPCAHWDVATVAFLRSILDSRFLYGWKYVMLAPEVTQQPALPYDDVSRYMGIAFCAGGSDPCGALDRMHAWALDGALLPGVPKMFLVGAQAGALGTDPQQAHDARCYVVPFAHAYLQTASLVVGMFGQTAYECLWYRTPMLCYGRNMADGADIAGLQQASGGALQTGWSMPLRTLDGSAWCEQVTHTWDTGVRQQMHDASDGLLDGMGIQRIAEAILELP